MSKTQNIKGEFQECFVAYIDILGFKELIKEVSLKKGDLSILTKVIKAVNITKNMMESGGPKYSWRNPETGESFSYQTQIHAFSDHILLFVPIKTRVSYFLHSIVMLHDRFLDCGCLIRGAVTIGQMYYDERWRQSPSSSNEGNRRELFKAERDDLPVAVGQGLINVYEAESKDSVYPRILLLDELVRYLKLNCKINTFPLTCSAPVSGELVITDFMRRDFDGLYHFHLLHPRINHRYNKKQVLTQRKDAWCIQNYPIEISYVNFMKKYREIIIAKLEAKKNDDEGIRKKLYWLANYFNLFCIEAPVEFE